MTLMTWFVNAIGIMAILAVDTLADKDGGSINNGTKTLQLFAIGYSIAKQMRSRLLYFMQHA